MAKTFIGSSLRIWPSGRECCSSFMTEIFEIHGTRLQGQWSGLADA